MWQNAINSNSGGGNSRKTLLYENDLSSNTFDAQTITIENDDYDYYELYLVYAKEEKALIYSRCLKNANVYAGQVFTTSKGLTVYQRNCVHSEGSFYFENCVKQIAGSTTTTTVNNVLLPYKIYGCKWD